MTIGVPWEIKIGETRVSMTPSLCRRCVSLGAQLSGDRQDARLRSDERLGRSLRGIHAVRKRCELGARVSGPSKQLFVGLAAEAALGVGNSVERRLELFEPSRLGLERREKRVQLRRRLTESQLDVAQLVAGALKLGSEPFERRHRTLRERDEPCGTVAVLGCQRSCGGGGRLRELGHVTQAFTLAAQALLVAGLQSFCVLGKRTELVEPRSRERRVRGQLVAVKRYTFARIRFFRSSSFTSFARA